MADDKPVETRFTPPADMSRPQLEQSVSVFRRRATIRAFTSAIIVIVVLIIAYVHRAGHG